MYDVICPMIVDVEVERFICDVSLLWILLFGSNFVCLLEWYRNMARCQEIGKLIYR